MDAANPPSRPNRVTSPRKSVSTIVPDPDLPVVTFIKGIDRSNSIVVIGRLIEGLFSNAKCECPDFKVELLDLSAVPLFAVHLPSSVSGPSVLCLGGRNSSGLRLGSESLSPVCYRHA